MTTLSPAARPGVDPDSPARRPVDIAVEVLVCGAIDRGDDGAPIAASCLLRGSLPPDVAVHIVGQLEVDDLLWISPEAGVVIVDAATGIDPGTIVDRSLAGLIDGQDRIRPRSSHALALPEVLGLAEIIRGRPLRGRIVAIGGAQFGLGEQFSWPVSAALRSFADAIVEAAAQLRPPGEAGARG